MKSLLMFAGLSFIPLSLDAADWNQYRGPNGDGKSSESIDADQFQSGMQKAIWKVPTTLGFSSFAVSDSAVYTVITREYEGENRETCIALDSETGKELWAAPLSSSDYGHDGGNAGASGNRGGDGPRNTPTVDGNRVYIYDGRLVLSCLDATDGTVVWRHDVVKEFSGRPIKWYNATSPLLHDQMLFVSGGGPNETFLAFDKDSGEVLWKTGDEMMTHATPHLATVDGTQQVIFFMQSGLVSLGAKTGELIWKSEFPFSVSTAASPISEGNQVYCSAGYGVGAGLFSINESKEADEVWFKANELMNHWSTPVVHQGHLYGIFEFKKYGRAPLQCVELNTGEIQWSQPGFGPGNCILLGDRLIVLSDTGTVALVEAKPDGYKELGRAQAIEGKCWSTPAFSNGRLYVRSTQEGACFDLSK
jgi:outer membrane protein assembly factor BamB